MKNNGSIESVIGYSFKNEDLLEQALTTKAYSNEHGCTDQSEFQTIGDAVLKLVLTETMMQKGNVTRENITKEWIELEKKEGLARVARKLDIRPFMKIGNGQKIQNHIESDHVLAETLEAIAGAIYLDGGLDNIKDLMAEWFEEWIYHFYRLDFRLIQFFLFSWSLQKRILINLFFDRSTQFLSTQGRQDAKAQRKK